MSEKNSGRLTRLKKQLGLFLLFVVALIAFAFVYGNRSKHSSYEEMFFGNVTPYSVRVVVFRDGQNTANGYLYAQGKLLPKCPDDDEAIDSMCERPVFIDPHFAIYDVYKLQPGTLYEFTWTDAYTWRRGANSDSMSGRSIQIPEASDQVPKPSRVYGRVLDKDLNPIDNAVVFIWSLGNTFNTDRVGVTDDRGVYYVDTVVTDEQNHLQNIQVFVDGELVHEFQSPSYLSRPYPDIVVGDSGSVLGSEDQKYSAGNLLISKVHAEPTTSPPLSPHVDPGEDNQNKLQIVYDSSADNIPFCKNGENFALPYYGIRDSDLDKARSQGMRWGMGLISDLSNITTYKTIADSGNKKGMIMILRLCYGIGNCPQDGDAYGRSLFKIYSDMLREGTLPAQGLFVQVGHNEPNVSEYRSADVEAQFVADTINALKEVTEEMQVEKYNGYNSAIIDYEYKKFAKEGKTGTQTSLIGYNGFTVISHKQKDSGLKLIGPTLDVFHEGDEAQSSLGHPAYSAATYLGQMMQNADFAQLAPDNLYAWAAADYVIFEENKTNPSGELAQFQNVLAQKGFTKKLFVVETGNFIKDRSQWTDPNEPGWSILKSEIAAMKNNPDIEAVLLFNSTGANPDPNFGYHQLLHNGTIKTEDIMGGCNADGFNSRTQELSDMPVFAYTIPSSPGNGSAAVAYTPVGGSGGASGGNSVYNYDPEPQPGEDVAPDADFCRLSENEQNLPPTSLPIPAKLKDGYSAGESVTIKFPEPGEYHVTSQKYDLGREYIAYFPQDERSELVVFEDANNNCRMDQGERRITDLSDFTVKKVGDVTKVHLETGINMFSLPAAPKSFTTADKLIEWGTKHYTPFYEANSRQVLAPMTTVGHFSNNLKKWSFLTNRGASYFNEIGEDFSVTGKEPLYVIANTDFDLRYRSKPFAEQPTQTMTPGWNFLGYAGYDNPANNPTNHYDVEQVRQIILSSIGLSKDRDIKLALWRADRSLFDSYVQNNGVSYDAPSPFELKPGMAFFAQVPDQKESAQWSVPGFASVNWEETSGIAHEGTPVAQNTEGCVKPVVGQAIPHDVKTGETILFRFESEYPYTNIGLSGDSSLFAPDSCHFNVSGDENSGYAWVWSDCLVISGDGDYQVEFGNRQGCKATADFHITPTNYTWAYDQNNTSTGSASDTTSITDNGSTNTTSANWWEYPEQILQVTKSGDDLLVLVNKKYKLPSSYAPSDLMTFSSWNANHSNKRISTSNDNFQLRSEAMSHLADLVAAADADGVPLRITSAYRSYATQESTYQYWVNYNGGNTSEADKISARPGHSQHQLGTAVDFSTVVNDVEKKFDDFTGTAADRWLQENAWKYGFALSYPIGAETITGYLPESWHYRYIGVDNATAWHNSGKVLDEWLREH